jgi:hypothetical protein
VQFLKALAGMFVIPLGIATEVRAVQFSKALLLIVVTLLGIFNSFTFILSDFNVVTLLGIVSVSALGQSKEIFEFPPMKVKLAKIVIVPSIRVELNLKFPGDIAYCLLFRVIDSGITKLVALYELLLVTQAVLLTSSNCIDRLPET